MLVCLDKEINFVFIILYVGTLVGITNTLAAIPGFVAPYVVGAITNNNVRIFKLYFSLFFFLFN
jgi:hypothetical protein